MFNPSKSTGYQAGGTNIQTPVTNDQATTAYGQAQTGLGNQAAFLQALQGQNGIDNQSSVFNQQQGLADQFKGVANGTGPDPALAQYGINTAANTANQAALMAGGRGSSANAGMMARQASNGGAANQQAQSANTATLQAQQQLAGMNALAGQQQAMGQTAGTQVGQQANATNNYATSTQNEQQNLLAAIAAQNNANIGMQSNINSANSNVAGINANNVGKGVMQGVGSAGQGIMTAAMGATGGKIKSDSIGNNPKMMADGGTVAPNQGNYINKFMQGSQAQSSNPAFGSQAGADEAMSGFGNAVGTSIGNGIKKLFSPSTPMTDQGFKDPTQGDQFGSGAKDFSGNAISAPSIGSAGKFAKGGKVPAMVSAGEKYLSPSQAQKVLQGKENPLNGKTFQGHAKVKGDSLENDTIPTTLEEGGCVIPRSVLQSKEPMREAIKFVHAHMNKMAKGGKVQHKPTDLNTAHFLFSAENPHVEPKLKMNHKQVLATLKKQGYPAEEVQGKYGQPETSIMVHGIKEKHVAPLMKLAKDLGQESAIVSNNGRHQAHYLNGEHEGQMAVGEGTQIHDKEPDNFYTKMKNGTTFTHNIDWDNKQPINSGIQSSPDQEQIDRLKAAGFSDDEISQMLSRSGNE